MTTYYYLDRWCDDCVPCTPTLDGWAQWLAGPDADWGRQAPAADGETFRASVLVMLADVRARRGDDGWVLLDPVPPGADWFALRYGADDWEGETIAASPERALAYADESGLAETEEIVVCAQSTQKRIVEFFYAAGIPRCIDRGPDRGAAP